MKKKLMILSVLYCASIVAMEEEQSVNQFVQTFRAMELDSASLEEFIHNKGEIIAECLDHKKPEDFADNHLFGTYSEFSDITRLPAIKAALSLSRITDKLHHIEDITLAHPDYQKALTHAKKENTEEAWRAWRFKAGDDLVKPLLVQKGLAIPEPKSTYNHVDANKDISGETAYWVLAHSVFLYKNRQLQRQITGKPLPPIKIKADKK